MQYPMWAQKQSLTPPSLQRTSQSRSANLTDFKKAFWVIILTTANLSSETLNRLRPHGMRPADWPPSRQGLEVVQTQDTSRTRCPQTGRVLSENGWEVVG